MAGEFTPSASDWRARPQEPAAPRRMARWAQWLLVAAAGLLAWVLFMLGAVLQREYLVLLFPAGWCLYVAMRQFRQIARGV